MTRLAPYRKTVVAVVTAAIGLAVALGFDISTEVSVAAVGLVEALLVFAVPNGDPPAADHDPAHDDLPERPFRPAPRPSTRGDAGPGPTVP
jgi:hypothetical protein